MSDFNADIWNRYTPGRRGSKHLVKTMWEAAIKSDPAAAEQIAWGLEWWLANIEPRFHPRLDRWFTDRRWEEAPERPDTELPRLREEAIDAHVDTLIA